MLRRLRMLMTLGFTAACLVAPLQADVVAFRDQSSNLWILDDKSTNQPSPILGVVDQYDVGTSVIAYNRGLHLYVATRASGWAPFLVHNRVRSFRVFDDKVVFKSGKSIYQVVTNKAVRDLRMASQLLSGRFNIRDYKLPNEG